DSEKNSLLIMHELLKKWNFQDALDIHVTLKSQPAQRCARKMLLKQIPELELIKNELLKLLLSQGQDKYPTVPLKISSPLDSDDLCLSKLSSFVESMQTEPLANSSPQNEEDTFADLLGSMEIVPWKSCLEKASSFEKLEDPKTDEPAAQNNSTTMSK